MFRSTLTLLCSAVDSAIQRHAMAQSHFHDPGRCAPRSCTWYHAHKYGTVSYRLSVVIRKNLLWNLPLYSVLYNTPWRSSSLVKNLGGQWRKVLPVCSYRNLANSVASELPIFFGFSTWCKCLATDIGFKWRFWSTNAFSGRRTWEEKQSFFLHFWRRSTSTGRTPSRHRFVQPRNQFQSWKNQAFIPSLHGELRATWQTKLQTDRKTIKRAWNLQDTTYPFSEEKRAQPWGRKYWS